MLNQTTNVEKVTDVIQIMKAGVEFYRDAVQRVNDASVKHTFIKMVSKKELAIQALQPLAIAEQGEVEDGSSIAVNSRRIYTKFYAIFTSDEDYTYIKQLEEVEDKILQALDDAIKEDQPGHALMTLTNVRADVQLMHNEIKALQEKTKH